jgi:phage shock protein E
MMKTQIWRLPLFGLLAIVLIAVTGCGQEPEVTSVNAATLSERLDSADAPVILDVRTLEEYSSGHVPGAINVPYDQVADRVEEFAAFRDADVVVYCQSGKRASMAAADLKAAGFSRVLDLEGHMQGWKEQGLPLE